MIAQEFQTTFAVPMTCQACVDDITNTLNTVKGVSKIDVHLDQKLVLVEGTAAPSKIVSALQDSGRDAIIRGSGKNDSAAVCIFEAGTSMTGFTVRGLARMVTVAPSHTIMDLAIRGLPAGKYWVTVRKTCNISQGAASMGGIWDLSDAEDESIDSKVEERKEEEIVSSHRGIWGTITIGADGYGTAFLDNPISVLDIIGRGMVVSKTLNSFDGIVQEEGQEDSLVGTVGRSAGVWENEKTVCACSGQTLWEERKGERERGIW